MANEQPLTTFDSIYDHLTTRNGYPVAPFRSPNPLEKGLSHAIASLSVHPTLEAILHILNGDLSSAHFLCRHMQNKPAGEGMFIHGLLHRVEGDYRNAEAWYGDVCASDGFKRCWPGGLEEAKRFIAEIETFVKAKQGDIGKLEEESKREVDGLVSWCKEKFGTGKLEDGTQAWVKPSEKEREMAAKMLVGGEGWRQF